MRLLVLLALLGAHASLAQPAGDTARVSTEPVRLSGPRIGITYLSSDIVDRINDDFVDEDDRVGSLITQFGWQFETRLFSTDTGLSGVTEFVPLLGGLEQGLLLPSFSFLVGLRTRSGFEFGFGPNASLGGVAYALAVGATTSYGGLNFPANVSAVVSDDGVRLSLLVGFNLAR
ncbi:MAG: hypothetical protein AAGI91_15715 [Bacteroidota bacterium]